MKTRLIIFLLLAYFAKTHSQDITISGYVKSESEEFLPYVSAYVDDKHSTITNEDGKFILNLPVKYLYDTLRFQSLGYHITHYVIKDTLTKGVIIKMQKKYMDISTINKIDKKIKIKPVGIIKKAMDLVHLNYTDYPVYLDCFYRSTVKKNGKYIRLNEAICQILYNSYSDKFRKKHFEKSFYDFSHSDLSTAYSAVSLYDNFTNTEDKCKLLQKRVSDNFNNRKISHFIPGGPLNLTSSDRVKYPMYFLHKLNNYNYVRSLDYLGDEPIYVISFRPKVKSREASFAGKIYIHAESFAFIKFEYFQVYNWNQFYPEFKVTIDYIKRGDKWCLSHILKEEKIVAEVHKPEHYKDTLSLKHELFVSNVIAEGVEKFRDNKNIIENKISSVLYKYNLPEDKEYWNKFNKITPSKLEEKIKSELKLNH